MASKAKDVSVVLHNVRSIHNVGSIFRTSDCLGITRIILVGYTPTPVDRFGRLRKDFAKVSLGAENSVLWQYCKTFSSALSFLKKTKTDVIAVEQSPLSKDYRSVKPKFPVAFVFGNEVEGIPTSVLNKCDRIAEIPMHGKKESLNVSVTVGIALARMLNC